MYEENYFTFGESYLLDIEGQLPQEVLREVWLKEVGFLEEQPQRLEE